MPNGKIPIFNDKLDDTNVNLLGAIVVSAKMSVGQATTIIDVRTTLCMNSKKKDNRLYGEMSLSVIFRIFCDIWVVIISIVEGSDQRLRH